MSSSDPPPAQEPPADNAPEDAAAVDAANAAAAAAQAAFSIPKYKLSPPMVMIDGQAVAANVGRWTKQEHATFVAALQEYGKSWKKIAEQVKTRTVIQTRTHAQKYYQKLEKTAEKVLAKQQGSGVVLNPPLQVPLIDTSTAAKKEDDAAGDASLRAMAPVIAAVEGTATVPPVAVPTAVETAAAAAAVQPPEATAEAAAVASAAAANHKATDTDEEEIRKIVEDAMETVPAAAAAKTTRGGKRKAAAEPSPPRETRSRRSKV